MPKHAHDYERAARVGSVQTLRSTPADTLQVCGERIGHVPNSGIGIAIDEDVQRVGRSGSAQSCLASPANRRKPAPCTQRARLPPYIRVRRGLPMVACRNACPVHGPIKSS